MTWTGHSTSSSVGVGRSLINDVRAAFLAGEVTVGPEKVLSWGGGWEEEMGRGQGGLCAGGLTLAPLSRLPYISPPAISTSFLGGKRVLLWAPGICWKTQMGLGGCPILLVHQPIYLSIYHPPKGNRKKCNTKPTCPRETVPGIHVAVSRGSKPSVPLGLHKAPWGFRGQVTASIWVASQRRWNLNQALGKNLGDNKSSCLLLQMRR